MSERQAIPTNWETARLADILPLSYGKSLPEKQRKPGKVPVFGSNGCVGYHDAPLTIGPCIVVGRKGAAGEAHYSPDPCWPIDTAYFTEGTPATDLKLYSFFLQFSRLRSLDRSTAVPSLSRDDYDVVLAPLPPLDEQHRIVGKIEELFSDLDAGVAAL